MRPQVKALVTNSDGKRGPTKRRAPLPVPAGSHVLHWDCRYPARLLHLRFAGDGSDSVESLTQLDIGLWVDLTEGHSPPGYAALSINDEQCPVVDEPPIPRLAKSAIALSYVRGRVASKEKGKLIVRGP